MGIIKTDNSSDQANFRDIPENYAGNLQKPCDKPVKALMINTVPMLYNGITAVMLNYGENIDRSELQLDFAAGESIDASILNRIHAMGSNLYEIPNRNRRPLSYVFSLAKLIHKNGYQIVHAHGNSCTLALEMVAARLGGAKVRCAHSHNTCSLKPYAHRLLRPIFDRSYTHGFACGEAAGRWLFRDKAFTVLSNGVNTEFYRFNEEYRHIFREKLNISNRIAIGNVANFTHPKNHSFLIDVFEKVVQRNSEYVLVLVGDGEDRAEIEEKVRLKHLEDNVIFTGVTRDIPQILSAMDFMVLPSLFEGLPNVLIEWQSSGLPSLISENVTEECKLSDLVHFLPLDEDVWVNAIMNMTGETNRPLSSENAIASIVAAGYDIKSSAAKLKELYFQYIKKD